MSTAMLSSNEASSKVEGYSRLARTFHWVTAALILSMLALGFIMTGLERGPLRGTLYSTHKTIGVLIAVLVLARIGYRLFRGGPAATADVPLWQRRLASVVHLTLYALILIVPLSGWVASSAYPSLGVFNGAFQLPSIAPVDRELAARAISVHTWLVWPLLALAVFHISAALYHHFVRKDLVLRRMTG